MNIRQEQTIKTTELNSTMQCAVDGEIWKRGAVEIGRRESTERWYSSYGGCDSVGASEWLLTVTRSFRRG